MSPAAPVRPDLVCVDDPVVGAGELDAFPCHGIEVDPEDHPADRRGPDVPVSARRHRGQSLRGLHSSDVGDSNRATMTRPLRVGRVAPAFAFRGVASLPVGVAMLFLVVLAGQTIVIAAIVIAGSVVGGRWRCGRQSECPRGDGDQGPQRCFSCWSCRAAECLARTPATVGAPIALHHIVKPAFVLSVLLLSVSDDPSKLLDRIDFWQRILRLD
jgi:hypothetical protein